MATAIITAAVLSLKATPPSSFTPSPQPAATAYQSPFAPDSLSLLFPSPVLRVNLEEVLPSGTFDALEEAILASWDDHLAEQATLAETGTRRATTEGERLRAASNQELNEEFFYYQRSEYGVSGQQSEPKGWLASEAAQELLDVITAVTVGYITRIAHHAGMDVGRPEDLEEDEEWELPLDPDKLHVWASVHHGESQHPRHVHMGAAVSGVFYLRVPPGAGRLCFFDPRGCIPPFEREVRHAPQRGEVLLFPPWLSHAVGCSGAADDGPRLSISFNYVDEELEGGRYGWGEATAGLDVVTLEDGLGMEGRHGADGLEATATATGSGSASGSGSGSGSGGEGGEGGGARGGADLGASSADLGASSVKLLSELRSELRRDALRQAAVQTRTRTRSPSPNPNPKPSRP